MKVIFTALLFCFSQLMGSQIDEKFSKSIYCIGCHQEQGKDWQTSLHSKSHITKNSLYLKILEHIEDKRFIYKEVQSLRCGKCHNPRMDTNDADMSFSLAKAYGLENEESKKVNDALSDSKSQDGISCITCHNVASIHYESLENNQTNMHKVKNPKRGANALKFGPNDTMVGPFKESHRTTYHKMKQVPHFKEEVNRLCFACHYDLKNDKNIPTYTTGIEYEKSQSQTKCIECHMSEQTMSIIAPNIKGKTEAIQRPTRRHLFAGVRNSDIVQKSLDISVTNTDGFLHITLTNITPHKVPTGFAGRELEIEVIYKDLDTIKKKTTKKLNTLYLDRRGNETISYIASKLKHDTRLNVKEKREYKIKNIKNATDVEVKIWYRLIKKSLIPILNIKDEVYLKKYLMYNNELRL